MAELSTSDRIIVRHLMEDDLSRNCESISVKRTDLLEAVNAADVWVSNNETSYNNALPDTAKTKLTARQKAMLLMYVINRRFEVT